jgi:hypothetical protein
MVLCSPSEAGIYTAPGVDSSVCMTAVKQSAQKSIFLHKSKEIHLTHAARLQGHNRQSGHSKNRLARQLVME